MGAAAMRKIVKVGLVALLASLRVAAPVEAQSYDDAVEAAQSGEYAKALILLHPLADRGDARGQFYLGTMYGNGLGVPQDHDHVPKCDPALAYKHPGARPYQQ